MATRTKSLADSLNRFFGKVPGEPNTKNFKFNQDMKEATSCWRRDSEIRENEKPGIRGIFGFGKPKMSVKDGLDETCEVLINEDTQEFCWNPNFSRQAAEAFFEKELGSPKPAGSTKPLLSERGYGDPFYDPKFRAKKRTPLR